MDTIFQKVRKMVTCWTWKSFNEMSTCFSKTPIHKCIHVHTYKHFSTYICL